MAARKKAPVPDRDWESEYRHLVSGMPKEQSARLTDWLVDTVRILSEALSVTGAVNTSYGCVKRTPKHNLVLNTNTKQTNQTMNIEDVTIREAREIATMLGAMPTTTTTDAQKWRHPLLGRRVLVRTYSAGVHIGTLVSVNPDNAMECHLKDALRLWRWEGGGLSLSAVAHNGIKGGRLNRTSEVVLTNAIEYIPVTAVAETTYEEFVED